MTSLCGDEFIKNGKRERENVLALGPLSFKLTVTLTSSLTRHLFPFHANNLKKNFLRLFMVSRLESNYTLCQSVSASYTIWKMLFRVSEFVRGREEGRCVLGSNFYRQLSVSSRSMMGFSFLSFHHHRAILYSGETNQDQMLCLNGQVSLCISSSYWMLHTKQISSNSQMKRKVCRILTIFIYSLGKMRANE